MSSEGRLCTILILPRFCVAQGIENPLAVNKYPDQGHFIQARPFECERCLPFPLAMILFRDVTFCVCLLHFLVSIKLKPFEIHSLITMFLNTFELKFNFFTFTCTSAVFLKLDPDSRCHSSITLLDRGLPCFWICLGFRLFCRGHMVIIGSWNNNPQLITQKIVSFFVPLNKNLDFSGWGWLMECAKKWKYAFLIIDGLKYLKWDRRTSYQVCMLFRKVIALSSSSFLKKELLLSLHLFLNA